MRSVTIELQPWKFPQRPRVLIEHPDPDTGLELAAALCDAGCNVAICRGPTQEPLRRRAARSTTWSRVRWSRAPTSW